MRQRGTFPKQLTAGTTAYFRHSFDIRHSCSVISKTIVTKFLQDFLYFTDRPMRNIAALASP
jgi:hypothetical protein